MFILLLISSLSYAQQVLISGKITAADDGGLMPGVSIRLKNNNISSISNVDGRYSILASKGNILIFSFIGFNTSEYLVKDNNEINIVLTTSINSLNEVVVTGLTTQRRSDVTAAISTISGKEILKSPVTNITNALMGRVPGLIAQQLSGRPGINQSELYIRGRVSADSKALIVVDGIERETFGDIDPNEIETITVLKDAASTALYGIKGANGVFVITTKSGVDGTAKISFTSNVAIQSYKKLPGILAAYESAMLHNEGQINVGVPSANRTFTDQDLQIFKDGTGDPLLYPNVNWYKALTRPHWLQTQNNVNISGGSKVATYFASFGHTFEDGIFKNFATRSNFKTTPDYNRYNFRSNVDFNLTKTTTIGVKLSGRLEKRYAVSGISTGGDFRQSYLNGEEGFVSRILFIPSWGLPFNEEFAKDPYNPNGAFNQIEDFQRLGTNTFNPYAVLTGSGYFAFDNNVTESIINFNQKLDKLTKGLSVRGVFGYTSNFSSVKFQTGSYAAYTLNRTTKQLSPSRNTFDAVLQGIRPQNYGDIKTTLQMFVNYERAFKKHNVASNIIGTRDLREIEGTGILAAPFANQGLVFNFTYNYDRKYFVQVNGAFNGSENYPVGRRYGVFPSLSLGYALSNEKFLEDVTWLSQLKIRGSVGLVGNPSPGGRFPYLDAYSRGGNLSLGDPNIPSQTPTYSHSQIGNTFFTWEKSLKRNIGVDASFFKDKFSFTADIYDDTRYDILLARNNTSFATYGESLPRVNFGENYNHGYEVELTHQNQIKGFYYAINAQISHNKNKINIADDPGQQPEYLNAIGQSIGQVRGFKVLGFYADNADIAANPVNKLTSNSSIPGDFKYQDINGDGVITNLDQVPIGFSNIPEYVGGLNLSLGYKGISFNILFQGVENVSSDLIFYSSGTNQYYDQMLGRWTPTNQNATWPAMRPGNQAGGNPNETNNDFLLQDASYVKLRNVELRYAIPKSWVNSIKLQGLSVYANGQNLKTWTKFYGLDPENYTNQALFDNKRTTYPSTRVINFGLSAQF